MISFAENIPLSVETFRNSDAVEAYWRRSDIGDLRLCEEIHHKRID